MHVQGIRIDGYLKDQEMIAMHGEMNAPGEAIRAARAFRASLGPGVFFLAGDAWHRVTRWMILQGRLPATQQASQRVPQHKCQRRNQRTNRRLNQRMNLRGSQRRSLQGSRMTNLLPRQQLNQQSCQLQSLPLLLQESQQASQRILQQRSRR